MRTRPLGAVKWGIVIVLLASLASFFFKIDFTSLSVGDLGRHITNGRVVWQHPQVLFTNFYSYTAPQFPFVNHHWLSGVVFSIVSSVGGFLGLSALNILVGVLAFGMVFAASLKKANFWVVAAVSLPSILILKERVELRPELFSYLCIALFIYLLIDFDTNPKLKRIFWLIPLQLLWVNLHSFFFIGILLVAALLLEKCIVDRKMHQPVVRMLGILLISLIAVSFVNPNGWRGAVYPLSIFSNYAFTVAENKPVWTLSASWLDVSVIAFLFMLPVTLISFLLSWHKKPVFLALIAAGAAIAGCFMVRNIPIFGLIILPVVSFNMTLLGTRMKRLIQPSGRMMFGFAALFAALIVLVTIGIDRYEAATGPVRQRGVGLAADTSAAADFFRNNHLHGPVFNDYDVGSFLIYELYPKERIFIDNRPEAYPASFLTNTYLPMIRKESVWNQKSAQYGFNVIFFSQRDVLPGLGEFLMRRMRDPSWALVWADAYAVILVKQTPEFSGLIERYQITGDSLERMVAPLLRSPRLADRIGAANLCILLGRTDVAAAIYTDITAMWPQYARGRWVLDQLEL